MRSTEPADLIEIGLGVEAIRVIVPYFRLDYTVERVNKELEQALRDLLRDLGVRESCFETLTVRGYGFDRLRYASPADLMAIGLGTQETEAIVTHFRKVRANQLYNW